MAIPKTDLAVFVLLWAFFVGSTAAGMVVAVRTLPWTQRQLHLLKKPWVCDVCMSFWSTVLVTSASALWQESVVLLASAGPAYAWTLYVLRSLTEPRGGPPLPALEDSDA